MEEAGIGAEQAKAFLRRFHKTCDNQGEREDSPAEDESSAAPMKQKPQESVMGDSVAASTLAVPAAAPTTAASTISYQNGDKAQEQCTSKKVGSKRHDKDQLPNSNFQTEVPLARWTVKEFLVAKQEHKCKTGVEKSRFACARGLPSSLHVMYDKIMQKGIDISDVDTDIPAFIQELRAHEKKVVSLFDKAQNVKKEAFLEEKETLNDIRTTSDALEKKYDELVDGLKTKLNIANGEGRSHTSKDQWQGQKISAHFQRGQHTEGVSNHWGRTIASFNKAVGAGVEREPLSNDAGQWKVALPTPQPQLNPNIKSFDADKIALFFDEWGETAEGQAFFASIDDYVRVKEQKMTTQMTDNSKWKGCQGPLDIPGLSEDIFDIFKDNVSNMDGAKPILYLFRNNHRRFASDIAFATCSALYHNVWWQYALGAYGAAPESPEDRDFHRRMRAALRHGGWFQVPGERICCDAAAAEPHYLHPAR